LIGTRINTLLETLQVPLKIVQGFLGVLLDLASIFTESWDDGPPNLLTSAVKDWHNAFCDFVAGSVHLGWASPSLCFGDYD
jgi:hypothetical protein